MKYVAYSKQNIKPKMTEEAQDYITENYINLVKPTSNIEQAYMSSRLIMNLIRLSVASAKVRLSQVVEKEDAIRAINLLIDSFKKQNIINTQGLMDIEKLEAVTPKNKREKLRSILEVVKEVENNSESKMADIRDIEQQARGNGIEEDIDEAIKILKERGDIYEPARGKYRIVK